MTQLIPPQAIEAEESILGAMLIQHDIVAKVFTLLQPEHFYKKPNGIIFRAIRKLYQQSLPIDILTVTDQLKKDRQIDNVGGSVYVSSLPANSSPVVSVEHHCLIIHQQYLRRKLGEEGYKTHIKTYDDSEDIFELLDSHSAEIIKMRTGMVNAKSKHISTIVLQNINDREAQKEGGAVGIPTISEKLTRSIYGWENGNLYVIAARPGMGKSAYVLSEARNMAENHSKKVWISTIEMSAKQQANRLLSNVSGVPFWKLKDVKRLTEAEHKRLQEADNLISELPIWLDDRGGVNIMDIRSAAITQKQEYGIDLIIIDYLQLISGNSKWNREQEVSEMSRAMKQLARDLDVPVLLLSQLSRAVETRGGEKIPQLSDLRESGCLTGDTTIMANGQTTQIRNLDGDKIFPILAYDNRTNEFMAKKCWKTKTAKTFRMQLTTGHFINATDNHKFLTSAGWLPLKEIGVGSYVAIPINFADNKKTPYSKDVAYLMGAMLANGRMQKRQPITYTCNTDDMCLAEKVNNIFESEFECKSRIENQQPKYNWINVFCKSIRPPSKRYRNPFVAFMDEQGIYDKTAKDKCLPDSIFYASKNLQRNLIAGLYDNDGSIGCRQSSSRLSAHINYSSASIKLIHNIQLLLQMNGIISRIKKLTKGKFTWYNLYISDRQSKLEFCNTIPLSSIRKKAALNDVRMATVSKRNGWSKTFYNDNKTLAFVEVDSIEENQELTEVYDIEVPNARNFVANGILAHNSIEQDADCVLFLYRAEYYKIKEFAGGRSTEGVAEVIIAKNRHGALQNVETEFDGACYRFSEPTEKEFEPKNYYETDTPF